MAGEIGRLVAIIDGDLSGLVRALGDAQKVLKTAGRAMTQVGKELSIGITTPIVAIGGLAIKASMDFETAFAGVRKTVDATQGQFAELRKGIIDMSKEMPMSAANIAKVVETAGQLGIKTKGLLEFAHTMVQIGETTDITAEAAAVGFAHIANIMEIPQEEIKKLAAGFVMLANEGASTGDQIINMSERIAGAGHTIGLTAPQVLAFAAGLADLGIRAEAGGTAFSRLLLSMSQAASGAGPAEEQLLAIKEAELGVANAAEAVVQSQRSIRDAYQGLTDAQRNVRDSAEGVTNAQRGVRDANEAVVSASRGVRDASEGVAAAHRGTRNATEALVDAQRNLVRVYRDARQASLDARRETLSVAEAYQGLREVQAQMGSHALEIREAQLAIAQAHKQVRDAAKGSGLEQAQAAAAVERAQARLRQVQAQGGREALDFRNAQLRVEEANARVGKSQEAYADQVRQANRGVRNATEGVADAQRAERNAREGVAAAIRGELKAREGVADAITQERNAREAYSRSLLGIVKAQEQISDAENAGATANEKLSIAQDRLALATHQAYGQLKTFAEVAGMLPDEFAALFKADPSAAIVKFVEGLKRVQQEGGSLFKIFELLNISEVRQIDELLRMSVGQIDFAKKIRETEQAVKDGTYHIDKYSEVTKTTAAQLQIMRNRVQANMIALGDQLTPVLLKVTLALAPLAEFIGAIAEGFGNLPGPIRIAILTFIALMAIIGPFLFALGSMSTGISILTAGLVKLGVIAKGASLLSLIGPWGLVIAAVVAVGVAVYLAIKYWDEIKAAVVSATNIIVEAVSSGFGYVLDFFRNNWREVATLIALPFAPVVALALNGFGIRDAIRHAFRDAGTWLYNAGVEIINGLIDGITSALKPLGKILNSIKPFIKLNKGPIQEDRKLLVPEANAIMEGLGTGMKQGMSTHVKPALKPVTNLIKGTPIVNPGPVPIDGGAEPKTPGEPTSTDFGIDTGIGTSGSGMGAGDFGAGGLGDLSSTLADIPLVADEASIALGGLGDSINKTLTPALQPAIEGTAGLSGAITHVADTKIKAIEKELADTNTLIQKHTLDIKDSVETAGEDINKAKIKPFGGSFVTDVGKVASFVKKNLPEIATVVATIFAGPMGGIGVGLATDAFGIRSRLTRLIKDVPGLASGLASKLKEGAASALAVISPLPSQVGDKLSSGFSGIKTTVESAASTAISGLSDIFSSAIETVKRNFNAETIGEAFGAFVFAPVKALRTGVQLLVGGIIEGTPLVIGALGTLVSSVGTFLGSTLPNAIIGVAGTVISASISLGGSIIKGIVSGLTSAIGAVSTFFTSTLPNLIVNGGPAVFNAAMGIGSGVVKSIGNGITTGLDIIKSAPGAIIKTLSEAFDSAKSTVIEIGPRILNWLWEGLKSATGWMGEQISGLARGFAKSMDAAFGFNLSGAISSGLKEAWRIVSNFFTKLGQIKVNIRSSHGIPGAGGISVSIPKLAKGATYVPQDMLALVHEGEMVVPKAVADQVRSFVSNPSKLVAAVPGFSDFNPSAIMSGMGISSSAGSATSEMVPLGTKPRGIMGQLGNVAGKDVFSHRFSEVARANQMIENEFRRLGYEPRGNGWVYTGNYTTIKQGLQPMTASGGGSTGQLGILAGKMQQYAEGTRYVPEDMIAKIHEGEMIIPANVASWFRSIGMPSASQNVMEGAASIQNNMAAMNRDRTINTTPGWQVPTPNDRIGVTISGPVNVHNYGKRNDAKGALGDLVHGMAVASRNRGYAL